MNLPGRPGRSGVPARTTVLVCSGASVDASGHMTNIGDEAATTSLQGFIGRRFPELRVLSTNSPTDRTARGAVGPDRFALRPVAPLLRRVVGARAVVFGGGTLLQVEPAADPRLPGPLLRWVVLVAKAARATGVPVAFCGVGAERLEARAVRVAVRALMRSVDSISCRDADSVALVQRLTTREVRLSADTTFLDDHTTSPRWTGGQGNAPMLVNLSAEITAGDLATTIEWVTRQMQTDSQLTLTLAPTARSQGGQSDRAVLSMLRDRWPQRCSWLPDAAGPAELSALAAESRAAVGSRLHFLLLAAQAGCPILPIPANAKVRSLVSDLGWTGDLAASLQTGPRHAGEHWLGRQSDQARRVIGQQLDELLSRA